MVSLVIVMVTASNVESIVKFFKRIWRPFQIVIGEKYSADEAIYGRGGKNWTQLPFFLNAGSTILHLFTWKYRTPLRWWPTAITKRWRWSFGKWGIYFFVSVPQRKQDYKNALSYRKLCREHPSICKRKTVTKAIDEMVKSSLKVDVSRK